MSAVRNLVGACLVVALAAGCTTGEAGPAPSPSPAPSTSAAPSEPVTLRFAVYGNQEQVESYVDLAEAFSKNHPTITVKVDSAPDAATAMVDLRDEAAQGNPPDVFLTELPALPTLLAHHRVHPVDRLLEERSVNFGDGYQRAGLEAFSADSSLQCMPHDVTPLVVYYNTAMLQPARVATPDEDPVTVEEGWTWDQFARAARQMSHGRAKGVYIAPQLQQLAPLIWSAGGELVDDPVEPTTLTLSDGDSAAALDQVLTLVRDPQITPSQAELARQGAVERFKRGRLGMILGTRALTPILRDARRLDFDVLPLPRLGEEATITAMNGYCISARTPHLQQAADFLAFAVGREGATITATSGYVVPSNLQVAHSPAFTQPGKEPQSASVFNEGVRGARRPPLVPAWPEVEHAVTPLLQRLFYAPVIGDLETALTRIDQVSQPILAPASPTPAP